MNGLPLKNAICTILSALLISSTGFMFDSSAGASEEEVSAASRANRFVVWSDITPGNYEILLRRSTDGGATWLPSVNLSKNPGPSYNPQIAVFGSNVYVVWRQENPDQSLRDIFFKRSTDDGATWGANINISSSGTNADALPQIATIGSRVYIVWHDTNPAKDVFIRRSTDNGAIWKPVFNISDNPGGSFFPQIAVSGANVYVVWEDGFENSKTDVFFRWSVDGGATWRPVKNLSNNPHMSLHPQIAE